MGYQPIDLSALRVTALERRPSKVALEDLGRTASTPATFAGWFATLPNILGASSLRELVDRTVEAIRTGRPVVMGIGGHVVKVGLAPMLCDLMRDGLLTAIAANGSVAIHDVELAIVGATSEDVDTALQDGSFGMSGETAEFILSAFARGGRQSGLGRALGDALLAADAPNAATSILAAAAKLNIPFNLCIALGTDIIHAHPQADGAAIGAGGLRDFRTFCSVVADLLDGGVYLNVGSAVLLPEMFLKAVSTARNLGSRGDFTTADFDFIRQYRPATNVVRRPHLGTNGRGYAFTGHHEIMLPLFWHAVREQLATESEIVRNE